MKRPQQARQASGFNTEDWKLERLSGPYMPRRSGGRHGKSVRRERRRTIEQESRDPLTVGSRHQGGKSGLIDPLCHSWTLALRATDGDSVFRIPIWESWVRRARLRACRTGPRE